MFSEVLVWECLLPLFFKFYLNFLWVFSGVKVPILHKTLGEGTLGGEKKPDK